MAWLLFDLLVSSIVDSYKKQSCESKNNKKYPSYFVCFFHEKRYKGAAIADLCILDLLFDFHQTFKACFVFDGDQSHDTIIRDGDDRPCETFT